MWLKLDLDGIDLYFSVTGYRKSTKANWSDEWCGIELNLQSESWLNFLSSGESMLACEVEDLLSALEDLLEDRIPEPIEMGFVEPDYKFVLNPKKDLRQDPRYTDVKPGYEIIDITVDFKLYFWNGWLTNNYLSLCMDREAISAFIVYLKVITRRVSKTETVVQQLLENGTLVEYY